MNSGLQRSTDRAPFIDSLHFQFAAIKMTISSRRGASSILTSLFSKYQINESEDDVQKLRLLYHIYDPQCKYPAKQILFHFPHIIEDLTGPQKEYFRRKLSEEAIKEELLLASGSRVDQKNQNVVNAKKSIENNVYTRPTAKKPTCHSCGRLQHKFSDCIMLAHPDHNVDWNTTFVESDAGKRWAAIPFQEREKFASSTESYSRQIYNPDILNPRLRLSSDGLSLVHYEKEWNGFISSKSHAKRNLPDMQFKQIQKRTKKNDK
jgi:hypothetical protein